MYFEENGQNLGSLLIGNDRNSYRFKGPYYNQNCIVEFNAGSDFTINKTKIIKGLINPTSINLYENYDWKLIAGEIHLSCDNIREKNKSMAYVRILGYMLTDGCLFYNNSKKKKRVRRN